MVTQSHVTGLRGWFGVEGVLTTSCSQGKTPTVDEVLQNTSSPFSVSPSALVLCNRYKSRFSVAKRTQEQSDGDIQYLCADCWIDSEALRGFRLYPSP